MRLAALELVAIELIAWLEPGAVRDASLSIKASLASDITEEERTIRVQALGLIEDGRMRFHGPAFGIKV